MNPDLSLVLTPEEVRAVIARKGDIHRATAAKVFSIPETEVTVEQRTWAKTMNFHMMYAAPYHVIRSPK